MDLHKYARGLYQEQNGGRNASDLKVEEVTLSGNHPLEHMQINKIRWNGRKVDTTTWGWASSTEMLAEEPSKDKNGAVTLDPMAIRQFSVIFNSASPQGESADEAKQDAKPLEQQSKEAVPTVS